jgi:Zn-dependent protease
MQSRLKKLGGLLVPLVFLASKAKGLLLALAKIKAMTTLGTMFISIVAYGLAFGWPFAVGFVLLLFVHEMGHVIQLRREGVEASAPIFIPFLGAVIAAKSLGKDAAAEVRVGLAGPILGTIGTLIPLAVWLATGSDLWRALAYIGFFINLDQPIAGTPLDGGRAMRTGTALRYRSHRISERAFARPGSTFSVGIDVNRCISIPSGSFCLMGSGIWVSV